MSQQREVNEIQAITLVNICKRATELVATLKFEPRLGLKEGQFCSSGKFGGCFRIIEKVSDDS